MILSPIEHTDLPFCRALRNMFRWSFLTTEIITPQQHHEWFRNLQQHDNVDFLVIFQKSLRVGTVSLTTHNTGIEVGNVCVDPKYQGKGIASCAIESLINPRVLPGVPYFARIRPDNQPSQHLFRKLGFQQTDEMKWTLIG